jgi:hypothetical protein
MRKFILFFLAAAFLLAGPSKGELALKAQFTVELASFLKFPSSSDHFVIVILGESPFKSGEFESYAKENKVRGREIRVVYAPKVPEGQECDLIFICKSEIPRAKSILTWCRSKKGILTVAEGDLLATQGVMVNLLIEGNHLKLGLNLRALEDGGFSIGSQVLKVSQILVPAK